MTIGPYHLQLMAAPITTEEGDYLGPLLLWDTVLEAPETAEEEYEPLAEELESDEREATVTLEEVSEPPVQDPGSFRRGAYPGWQKRTTDLRSDINYLFHGRSALQRRRQPQEESGGDATENAEFSLSHLGEV